MLMMRAAFLCSLIALIRLQTSTEFAIGYNQRCCSEPPPSFKSTGETNKDAHRVLGKSHFNNAPPSKTGVSTMLVPKKTSEYSEPREKAEARYVTCEIGRGSEQNSQELVGIQIEPATVPQVPLRLNQRAVQISGEWTRAVYFQLGDNVDTASVAKEASAYTIHLPRVMNVMTHLTSKVVRGRVGNFRNKKISDLCNQNAEIEAYIDGDTLPCPYSLYWKGRSMKMSTKLCAHINGLRQRLYLHGSERINAAESMECRPPKDTLCNQNANVMLEADALKTYSHSRPVPTHPEQQPRGLIHSAKFQMIKHPTAKTVSIKNAQKPKMLIHSAKFRFTTDTISNPVQAALPQKEKHYRYSAKFRIIGKKRTSKNLDDEQGLSTRNASHLESEKVVVTHVSASNAQVVKADHLNSQGFLTYLIMFLAANFLRIYLAKNLG